ncbi:DUF943 family protein [Kosakonia sp. BYX6]|uniref:DUF943 family protein n=1 Tax=Kosakonia calanthes TaxID=3139408 RepID=A0ABZ3BAX8_9ENTR
MLIIILCLSWLFLRSPTIVRVDNDTVYVKNLPLTNEGKIDWWKKNKELLQEKYNIINDPKDFTVIIMHFKGYERLPAGTRDGSIDDYHCFDDIKDKENCIYNDIAMIVSGNLTNKVFYRLDDKIFDETPDGKINLLKN